MREIKFRGREKESNKWVFGYARHWKCCYGDEWHIQGENDNVHIVIPETVGQYTGKKDVNKKEIFEGDVVLFCDSRAHERIGVIKWHEKACCWIIDCGGEAGRVMLANYAYEIMLAYYACEIRGNVHDNPELLS